MASNTPVAKSGPLDFMERLSPVVYFYKPASDRRDASSPRLITMCSWMNAQDAHIAKYLVQHQATHPTSPMLLIRCPLPNTFLFAKARREIAPAVSVISSLFPAEEEKKIKGDHDDRPEMLLHVFSNGGCASLHQLVRLLHAEKNRLLPLHVTIFDSCPGQFHWNDAYAAFSMAFPPILRPLAHVLIVGLVLASWMFAPDGNMPQVAMAAALNGEAVLGRELGRAYVFSGSDRLIRSGDVVAHAEDARKRGGRRGIVVRTEDFGESAHVAHMRSDPERYWRVVKEVWEGK